MRGRLYAWGNLGYRFARHVLALPLRAVGLGRGARHFLDAVVPEGYVPLGSEERANYPARMTCVSCGLCALAPETSPASAWEEPWTFVVGASRSIDMPVEVAASVPDGARDGEAVCPMGVPIAGIREGTAGGGRRDADFGSLI